MIKQLIERVGKLGLEFQFFLLIINSLNCIAVSVCAIEGARERLISN